MGIGCRGSQCARRVLHGDAPLRKSGQRRHVPAAAQQNLRKRAVRRNGQPCGLQLLRRLFRRGAQRVDAHGYRCIRIIRLTDTLRHFLSKLL